MYANIFPCVSDVLHWSNTDYQVKTIKEICSRSDFQTDDEMWWIGIAKNVSDFLKKFS